MKSPDICQQTLFSHRDNLDKRPPENRESAALGPDQAEKRKKQA